MRFFIFSLILFFAICQKSNAQLSASATLDKAGMFIGDQATLNINILADNNLKITSIGWDSLTKYNFEKLSTTPVKLVSNSERTLSATITTFEIGEMTIPPIPIILEEIDTIYTNPLKINVYPVAVDSSGLAPIKDIIIEEKTIGDYWIPIVLVAFLMIAIGWFYRWKQSQLRKDAIIYEQSQTPKAKALRKLNNLESQNYPQKGEIKLFCNELTYILREYLEGEYGFGASKMTSPELLAFCRKNDILSSEQADLQVILNISDHIKFAQGNADASFFEDALKKTKAFVK